MHPHKRNLHQGQDCMQTQLLLVQVQVQKTFELVQK